MVINISGSKLLAHLRMSLVISVAALIVSCSPQTAEVFEPNQSSDEQSSGAAFTTATIEPDPDEPEATRQKRTSVATLDSGEASAGEVDASNVASVPSNALEASEWKELPVVPEFSERAREIFQAGIESGNDPTVFAKVGDCQNVPSMFLSIFDYPGYYSLGEDYSYLQETIDWYRGSFSRESEAVRRGFNAASVVSAVWADPESCEQGETPLECEIRINNPSVAIVSLETWWAGNPENYEKYVRQIIEGLLEHDILPIVATKADNLEGDHQINEILAGLAMEYQIPVWNFWRAVQPLPGNGLLEDRFHLTFDENHFDDPEALQAAWPWRNLSALQVLDEVRSELVEAE